MMVNYLTTPGNVRNRLGLNSTEAHDDVVNEYIIVAQKDLRRDISFYEYDDVLSGNIDGTNTTFATSNSFVADLDYNNVINTLDITVYGWTIATDPGSRTEIAISTIYPEYGKVVTNSAPSGFAKITANYYFYDTPVDTDLIPEACADLAAFYFAEREILLMPKQWMHGAYRFMKSGEYKVLIKRYYSKVDRIIGYAMLKGEHDPATLIRGE